MTYESLRIATGVKTGPTSEGFKAQDGTTYTIFSDGSRRRDPVKLRGKANVKARKRAGLVGKLFA